jgi:hypothetical protein
MPVKLPKDPLTQAGEAGCLGGCLTYFFLYAILSSDYKDFPVGVGILLSIIVGSLAFLIVKKIKTAESDLENKNVECANSRQISSGETPPTVNQQIQFLRRATYFGGDKQCGTKSYVSVVFTKDRILLKELPGNPFTRIDIPYGRIIDFGLATKEQLTISRMLIVGILAFALKKKKQYLYIKYRDDLGFENNPVIGEFIENNISDITSRIYTLIQNYRTSKHENKS